MHTDEAVHAVKFDTLWQEGEYRYDPEEYHGPTLYYAALPIVWLSGVNSFADLSATMFRLVPVLFGVGLILLLLLIADGLGRASTICAGVLTAVSPAMVYFSRYYIQEILLVFFTFAAIACGWRYVRSRHWGWALATGAALGLMHATKETAIIAFGALLAAVAINTVWHWRPGAGGWVPRAAGSPGCIGGQATSGTPPVTLRGYFRPKALLAALLLAIALSALFYSGFFSNLVGPLDSVRTYTTYFDRASGHGIHVQPWHYYLRMLLWTHYAPGPVWTEALILALAAIGMVATFTGKGVGDAHRPLLRFLTVYTLLLTVIYTTIPYKTPWSMLSFLHGMLLLAGVGAMALVVWVRYTGLRVVVALALAVGALHLGGQARQATSPRWCADNHNPYAYAHALRGVERAADWVERVSAFHADGNRMLIKVIAPDPWPLPWYLRRFGQVGYWEEPPEKCDAPVVITTTELDPPLDDGLHNEYQVSYYGMRADVVSLVYVEQPLWDRFAASFAEPASAPASQARP
jgi:uncharacterized protein (TIGR03663 family)